MIYTSANRFLLKGRNVQLNNKKKPLLVQKEALIYCEKRH